MVGNPQDRAQAATAASDRSTDLDRPGDALALPWKEQPNPICRLLESS
jgi:hypothetical protein